MTRRRELVARLDDAETVIARTGRQLDKTTRERDFLARRVVQLQDDAASWKQTAALQLVRNAELAAGPPVVVIEAEPRAIGGRTVLELEAGA